MLRRCSWALCSVTAAGSTSAAPANVILPSVTERIAYLKEHAPSNWTVQPVADVVEEARAVEAQQKTWANTSTTPFPMVQVERASSVGEGKAVDKYGRPIIDYVRFPEEEAFMDANKCRIVCRRTFEIGKYGPMYQFMGEVGKYAELLKDIRQAAEARLAGANGDEDKGTTIAGLDGTGNARLGEGPVGAVGRIDHNPLCLDLRLDWFFGDITVWVDGDDPNAVRLMNYMSYQETPVPRNRNTSRDTGRPDGYERYNEEEDWLHKESFRWTNEQFMLILHGDRNRRNDFIRNEFFHWYHRADYLVRRYSKNKAEFRSKKTLDDVLKKAATRTRRLNRRDEKDAKRMEKLKAVGGNEDKLRELDNYVSDMVPRELREILEKEGDGMDDIRAATGNAQSPYHAIKPW